VRALVATLQGDDIYKVAESFPSPDHRTTRLATQAGMLYIILFFAPDLLNTK
jgi:WASH complex subunit strumpellin